MTYLKLNYVNILYYSSECNFVSLIFISDAYTKCIYSLPFCKPAYRNEFRNANIHKQKINIQMYLYFSECMTTSAFNYRENIRNLHIFDIKKEEF